MAGDKILPWIAESVSMSVNLNELFGIVLITSFSTLTSMTRGYTCFHRDLYCILSAVPLFIVPTITAPTAIAPTPLPRLREADTTFHIQPSLTPRSIQLSSSDWGGIAAIAGIIAVIVAVVGIILTYLGMPRQRRTRKEIKERERQNGRKPNRIWYGQVKGLFVKKRPRQGIWARLRRKIGWSS